MALELKEVFETLGLEPDKIKTIEDFKTNVDNTFTRNTLINEDSEPVKKILGKLYGTLENEIKKVAKTHEVEVDFSAPELKDKKVKDKLVYFVDKFSNKNKAIIDELTANVGIGNDEKVKEWEKKYDKINQKTKDLQALLDATTNEYNAAKENYSTQLKNKTLDVHKKELFGKAKWVSNANDYTKKGFISSFEQEFKLDIDEQENPIILNQKGERIPSKKTVGTFMSPYEVWEEQQIKAGLFPINSDGGKQKPNPFSTSSSGQQPPARLPNGRLPGVVAPRLK